MAKIGFIGTGRMGAGMVDRLLKGGHQVSVWNRTPSKVAPLVARGAVAASTPAEAAADAEAVFSIVSDDQASRTVWLGPNGALSGAASGTIAIECSTLSRDFVAELAQAVRGKGLAYIDCPVTGWPDAAASGQLTLLVGAEALDLERARPFLLPLAKAIRHFGGVGAGTGFKLINNLLGAVHIAALAEAMVLAEELALDRETVVQALLAGAVASPQVTKHARPMAERAFSPAPVFTAGLRHKDAAYCLAAASVIGVPMPIGEAAADWFRKAGAAAFDADEASVISQVARAVTKRR